MLLLASSRPVIPTLKRNRTSNFSFHQKNISKLFAENTLWYLAGDNRFELIPTHSKYVMLPLHQSPIVLKLSLAEPTGFEPATFSVTGRHATFYTSAPQRQLKLVALFFQVHT